MNVRISDFIKEQTVATVCCVDENNMPYCFSCFYVFHRNTRLILFKSSSNSHHAGLLLHDPNVAGAIQRDKLNKLAIRGLQFTGVVLPSSHPLAFNASLIYHKKYPFALAMPGDVCTLRLDTIKMTDNTLAFGKKINWNRENDPSFVV